MEGFGFETILKAIYRSFTLKKNLVAVIHLLIGLGVFAVFAIAGSFISYQPVNIALPALGSIFMYYVLIRMTYILSFFALHEITPDNEISYAEAGKAFGKQRWTALFVPIVFGILLGAIIGLQVLLLKALDLIPMAGSIFNALLFLPLFAINFALLIVVFFGGNIVYGIMIKEQTKVLSTIRAVCSLILRQSRIILIYWLLASMLIITISLLILVFGGLALIPALGGAFYNLLPMIRSGINMHFMFNTGLISELINPVAAVIMLFNLVLIVAFLLSFLINIQVGVNISIFHIVQGEVKDKKKVAKAKV